ncbi:MAG: hypothetical protein ACP5G1_01665 [Nanopusillaceae archaeon]
MVTDGITYALTFAIGFLSAEYITKKFKPELFIEIVTKSKIYKTKIHHLYFSFAALLTYIFNLYMIALLFLGIGIHDLILEIKKILNYRK